MKKILFSILAICLLAVMTSSVSATVTWNTAGTVLPSTLTMSEDIADNSFGDLNQYVGTDNPPITGFTSLGSTHITVTWPGGGDIPTLTPDADWYGTENIIFTATDADGSVDSPSVSVTVNSVNDDPSIVGTIPAQTKVEDSVAWTLDLTAYESDVEDLVGPSLTWSVSGVDTTKFNAVVTDINNDIVTFTPVANAFGSDLITFTLTDSVGGTDTQDVVVTLTSAGNDDEPVLSVSIPDQKWTKGTDNVLDLKNYFSDPDDPTGLTLTYGWEVPAELLIDITLSEVSGVVTFSPIVDSWKGSYDINFTVSDGVHDVVKSNELTLVVRNKPDFICEEGERGDLIIDSVSDPDSGDDFKPGEEIKIKLNIENNHQEDNLDVVVEAFLYDETDDKVIESVESDSQEIKDGKDETFEFYLKIALDEDIDEDNDYKLLLKVSEDGNEDDHCVEWTEIDLNLQREDHDVIISQVTVTPSTVSPGETIEFVVDVENIGDTDEDDVTIRLKETTLGLDLVSTSFDLDDATGDDNDKTERFTFTVPSNIAPGTYDGINVAVYDEDEDVFDESDDAERFVSLVVSGSAVTITEDIKIEMVGDLPSTIEPDKTYSIPVKITNNKATREMITISLINIDDWATSTSEKVLTLDAGKSETVYLSLKANEELGEGKYTATVEAKDGTASAQKTITLGAEDEEGIFENVSMNTIFYIIGYIVLIIVAIFFIKLFFSRRKGKVKEVRL